MCWVTYSYSLSSIIRRWLSLPCISSLLPLGWIWMELITVPSNSFSWWTWTTLHSSCEPKIGSIITEKNELFLVNIDVILPKSKCCQIFEPLIIIWISVWKSQWNHNLQQENLFHDYVHVKRSFAKTEKSILCYSDLLICMMIKFKH